MIGDLALLVGSLAYVGFFVWLPLWASAVRRRTVASGGPAGVKPYGTRLLFWFKVALAVQSLIALPVVIGTSLEGPNGQTAVFAAVCGILPWIWMLFAYSKNPGSYEYTDPPSVWWATGATFFAMAFCWLYLLAYGLSGP